MASSSVLKRNPLNRRSSGCGYIFSVALVMTPKVPSEPRNSLVSSGPVEWSRTGSVRVISPVGSTTSIEITRSSILPYLELSVPDPRLARNPPKVEQ